MEGAPVFAYVFIIGNEVPKYLGDMYTDVM